MHENLWEFKKRNGRKSWQKWSLKGFSRKLHPYTADPPQWPVGSRWADGLDDLRGLSHP